MNCHDYITVDPAVLVGKPVVRGTRLAVEFVLGLIAQGWPEEEIMRGLRPGAGERRKSFRATPGDCLSQLALSTNTVAMLGPAPFTSSGGGAISPDGQDMSFEQDRSRTSSAWMPNSGRAEWWKVLENAG
jgi:hypothetical protein